MEKKEYDFDDPLFQRNFLYRRLAKEHLELQKIQSDKIGIEVENVRGPLDIPDTYTIHYYIRSIVGINEDQSPKYSKHHIAEIYLPVKFPMEPPRIYMKSDLWHPNIKWDGKFKGRICGNTKEYGKGYDLVQLVYRIGEILQYKNYHAENTPPFPEDSMVAKWVKEYAEPNKIVDKWLETYTDYSDLTAQSDEFFEDEYQEENNPTQIFTGEIPEKKASLKISMNTEPSSDEEDSTAKKISFKK